MLNISSSFISPLTTITSVLKSGAMVGQSPMEKLIAIPQYLMFLDNVSYSMRVREVGSQGVSGPKRKFLMTLNPFETMLPCGKERHDSLMIF